MASTVTKSANIDVTAREVDFVTRFGNNWDALREIIGISRPIRKANGTMLKSKTAKVTLEDSPAEGAPIPYSLAEVEEVDYDTITIEKYAKAVSIEAIADHGAEVAIAKTDEAFLNELQGNVLDRFYTYLQTGTLTKTATTFQMGIAKSIGAVKNKFKAMRKNCTEIAVFVNVLDAYEYLGAANITIQNAFGMDYIENFMGAKIVFLTSEIPSGKVIATPVDNIVLYYVDPSDSEFARAGLSYTTQGATNLIGFHVQGNYNTAVSESFALLGLTLFAEYIDGICVTTIPAVTTDTTDETEGN